MRWFLLLVLAAGCAAPPRFERSEAIVWSSNIRYGVPSWLEASERYFHQPVLLLAVHGGYRNGEWYFFPDQPMPPVRAEDAAWFLRSIAKGRVCVITACNAGGFELHVPGVRYARQTAMAATWLYYPGCVNDIRKFHEGR